MKTKLYPSIEPFHTEFLKVSDGFEIYMEQVGNPNGQPVIFFHGGPGGGITPDYRRFFDPNHYHVILFDQRGAGRSRPHAELKNNTTWKLIEDTESIRKKLNIEKWIVFGGSWGSTLALVYAETHPERVQGLCLRGIFTCRPQEIQWFYQEGASRIYPDAFEAYQNHIPKEEQQDLVKAYYKRLTSEDQNIRLAAAKHWSVWEGSTSQLFPEENFIHKFDEPEFALAFARIECHYFTNNIFLETDTWIMDNTDKIQEIPMEIVHGRYDIVCPVENAWELKARVPKANLHIIGNAGHTAFEPEIAAQLVACMESFKSL